MLKYPVKLHEQGTIYLPKVVQKLLGGPGAKTLIPNSNLVIIYAPKSEGKVSKSLEIIAKKIQQDISK